MPLLAVLHSPVPFYLVLKQARGTLTREIGQIIVLDKLDPISLGSDCIAVSKEGNMFICFIIKLYSTL